MGAPQDESGVTVDTPSADVSIRIEGQVGRLTLCRSRALNALSHEMVLTIESTLENWQTNEAVALVMIDAEGDKAFCAGGDVTALYQQGKAGDVESGRQFWRDEYRLNTLIDSYPKPFVAIMDGITIGGGIGISAHGSHRVVTERSTLSLPECSIGLVPDVGTTHLLSQSPGCVGEFLALTGERFGASDALFAGFADYYVPVENLNALKDALIKSGDTRIIEDFHQTPKHSILAERMHDINRVFGQDTLAGVLNNLAELEHDWAQSAVKKIGRASPLSLLLSFDLVRDARSAPGIEKALTREYRFVSRVMEQGDFLEGVRAALIDKDRQPNWKHTSVAAVTQEEISRLKEVAPEGDPVLHH